MRKLVNTVLAGALGLSMIAGVSAQLEEDQAGIIVQTNEDGLVSPLIIQAPDFGTVEYSVGDQNITSSAPNGDLVIQVTYDRGDSAGWSVSISGGHFTSGEESDAHSFDIYNLTLGSGSVTVANPGNSNSVDATHGNGHQMTETPTEIISGTEDIGSNGIFTITYTSNQLTIPGGTPVDEYRSTLEVEVTASP